MATVMIVEDNEPYRDLLRQLCESEGHEVLDAWSAAEALRQLRVRQSLEAPAVELFVVDFHMEGMNGFEFIQAVRQMDGMARAPVMMVSATSKDMLDVLTVDGVAFIPKPCPNAEIVAQVRRFVGEPASKDGAKRSERPAQPFGLIIHPKRGVG